MTGKPVLASMSSGNKTPPPLPRVSSLTAALNLPEISLALNFLAALSVVVAGERVETFD